MGKAQEDPSKYFGSTDYFRNKDRQRGVVNNLRREERNKRIMQQGLTRNIKQALRKGKDPSGFINAAKGLGIDPTKGGGLGPEASQRDAVLRARANTIFEEMDSVQQKEQGNQPNANDPNKPQTNPNAPTSTSATASPTASATNTPPTINPAKPVDLPDNLSFNNEEGKFNTELGQRARAAFSEIDDPLQFKQGLDRAIKMAKTPQEIDELRTIAEQDAFIPVDAFNSRVSPELLSGAPDWAKDVKNDKTFKGQDLSRFGGITRAQASEQIMKEKAAGILSRASEGGRVMLAREKEASDRLLTEQQKEIARQQKERTDNDNMWKRIAELTNPAYRTAEQKKNNDFQSSVTDLSPISTIASNVEFTNEINNGLNLYD